MQYIHVSDNNELVSENEQTPQNICLYIISVLLAYKRAEQMKKKKRRKNTTSPDTINHRIFPVIFELNV